MLILLLVRCMLNLQRPDSLHIAANTASCLNSLLPNVTSSSTAKRVSGCVYEFMTMMLMTMMEEDPNVA